jgi:hypothetical protein
VRREGAVNKIVELTGREQQLVMDDALENSRKFRQMIAGADEKTDPGIVRIWRGRVREYEVLVDKVRSAELV